MKNAGAVGLGQRVGDLDGVVHRLGGAQALRRNQFPHCLALDALHDDEVHPVAGADVVDGDDVRVVQRAGRLGFLNEALFAGGISDLVGGQDLDRHRAVQVGVVGLVNHTHAAFTELRYDPVVVERPADHEEQPHYAVDPRPRWQISQ